MKTMMNFTLSPDDVERFSSSEDLKNFYKTFGCDGLELMPLGEENQTLVTPDMTVGIHACCIGDWINLDQKELIRHYRKDLDYAQRVKAEYVVFHITQVNATESCTYQLEHTDEEVIDAAADFINELLDGQDYSFYFLMENLWWPGLNFLRPEIAQSLLEKVHYEKKGFMLDTGHFLHTNRKLRTQKEALSYLHSMLDRHEDLLPYFKGIHLQQSLTGAYVEQWLQNPPPLSDDPSEQFTQVFEHIFSIDRHEPFTESGVRELVERIDPLYVTYEYITRSREELAEYLKTGSEALK